MTLCNQWLELVLPKDSSSFWTMLSAIGTRLRKQLRNDTPGTVAFVKATVKVGYGRAHGWDSGVSNRVLAPAETGSLVFEVGQVSAETGSPIKVRLHTVGRGVSTLALSATPEYYLPQ